jgi:methyl-accepting chemotaxis protein
MTDVAIAIGFPIALLMWLLPQEKVNGYDMKTESTHYVVDMAWSVLDYYGQQVSAGKMPLAQAQELAKSALRRERFQNGNYVWINDSHPTMIMHPMKPEMDGKDLSGYRDPNGVAVFVEMAHVCAARGKDRSDTCGPSPVLRLQCRRSRT